MYGVVIVNTFCRLGFLSGFITLFFLYGRRVERFIDSRRWRSYYALPHHTQRRVDKRTRLESTLTIVALSLIMLGILDMFRVFS